MATTDRRLPATLLTGFLGAGKTSVLNHLLNCREQGRIAVIVNDMSEINIDADLLIDGSVGVARSDEQFVELSNGCICCTLREDLLTEVRRLAEAQRFDYLLIESTGIAEPLPIAASFSFRDEQGRSLAEIARLDTVVTVVDALGLPDLYDSLDTLRDRGLAADADDARSLVDLLVDQIEFADVVLVNKVGDTPADQLDRVHAVVRALNPAARVVETDFGRVASPTVMGTGAFTEENAARRPLWHKALHAPEEHVPETEEYGIASFVYRARRPFDATALRAFMKQSWPGVLRAKGHFWIASRPAQLGHLSWAGAQRKVEARGQWWVTVPRHMWPTGRTFAEMLKRHWSPVWGDRRQELVFIGTGMNEAAIRSALDACLTGPEGRLEHDGFQRFAEAFPRWEMNMPHRPDFGAPAPSPPPPFRPLVAGTPRQTPTP